MRDFLLSNIKNFRGWSTKRKLVIFSVDDYGNVRLDSPRALENLKAEGIITKKRYDKLDALETRADLEQLYETLNSVTDKNGNAAVFTPYTIPCNINFEAMANNGYKDYAYEVLSDTFSKLEQKYPNAYVGAWDLWQEGVKNNLMRPQFHGREHFNLNLFRKKLAEKDKTLIVALQNRSFIDIPDKKYHGIKGTAAFAYSDKSEIADFPEILITGLNAFEKIFAFRASVFTPPATKFPQVLESSLGDYGVKAIDKPFEQIRQLDSGKNKREFSKLGFNRDTGIVNIVRNASFEPQHSQNKDWVGLVLKQIEAAFRWNKPANISSHRVNYCGHIEERNRLEGLAALKELLRRIVKRWPDVEFIGADQLCELILNSEKAEHV